MSDLLLAFGITALVPSAAFASRWLASPASRPHWSGWAFTGCLTLAAFAIVLGNLIR